MSEPGVIGEEVSSANLEEVCNTFDRCFHHEEERNEARALYQAFAAGTREFAAVIPPRIVRLEGYWLHRLDGKPVGISGLYSDAGSLWIGWFGVVAAMRRQGIGSKIIGFLFEQAARLGWKKLSVFALREELKVAEFYRRMGFVDCDCEAVDRSTFLVLEALVKLGSVFKT